MRDDFDPSGTLRVLGYDFAIVAATDGEHMDGYDGLCDEKRSTLHVRSRLPADKARETTLHEIVHAVSNAMDAELEERQVLTISRGLYAVCRDNPEYMKALLFGD